MKAWIGICMATVLASACLVAASARPAGSLASGTPVSVGFVQEGGWDAPPPELDEVTRRGFHDGIEGARKDYDNHRRPDVNNRDEFRHPHVAGRDRDAYRNGYARGYQVGVDHLYHGHV